MDPTMAGPGDAPDVPDAPDAPDAPDVPESRGSRFSPRGGPRDALRSENTPASAAIPTPSSREGTVSSRSAIEERSRFHPTGNRLGGRSSRMVAGLRERGDATPIPLQFRDLLETRLGDIRTAFEQAIADHNCQRPYVGIHPATR